MGFKMKLGGNERNTPTAFNQKALDTITKKGFTDVEFASKKDKEKNKVDYFFGGLKYINESMRPDYQQKIDSAYSSKARSSAGRAFKQGYIDLAKKEGNYNSGLKKFKADRKKTANQYPTK